MLDFVEHENERLIFVRAADYLAIYIHMNT
jgi:hypothetical protein